MKKSEITVEALKKMGYTGFTEIINFSGTRKTKQESDRALQNIVDAVQNGIAVRIAYIDIAGTVRAVIDNKGSWRKPIQEYAERQMTEIEITERNIRLANIGATITIE